MHSHYKTTSDSEILLSELMLPNHTNFSGKIHGGVILSLMDKAAFSCASKHSGHYCVTASVNRVDFLHPIEVGELVTLKARINYAGNSSMVIGIRVESQIIQTGEIKHCNSSYFTMVARDKNGNSAKVPGLIIRNTNELRRFLRAVKGLKSTIERDNEFKAANFDPGEHHIDLTTFNVKLMLTE
ncbi:MAG: acyl-CoA thioesterase [Flavobacteriaceae bacterium]|nr:acyl-CoA thioesterase [Flavobacteriaceae bacterium]